VLLEYKNCQISSASNCFLDILLHPCLYSIFRVKSKGSSRPPEPDKRQTTEKILWSFLDKHFLEDVGKLKWAQKWPKVLETVI
jgi:hypothetical protein